MRFALIFLLFFVTDCSGQTPSTGKAETLGACSPAVTGNDNRFIIKCSGISKEQGQQMLTILNKILAKQLDPNAVMEKLDEISKGIHHIQAEQGWPELTREQTEGVKDRLRSFAPQKVRIVVTNSDNNKWQLARQLQDTCESAGWHVIEVGSNTFLGPPVVGIYVSVNKETPPAVAVLAALRAIFGQMVVSVTLNRNLPEDVVSIGIYDSPALVSAKDPK